MLPMKLSELMLKGCEMSKPGKFLFWNREESGADKTCAIGAAALAMAGRVADPVDQELNVQESVRSIEQFCRDVDIDMEWIMMENDKGSQTRESIAADLARRGY
jgi:hypothetical protein